MAKQITLGVEENGISFTFDESTHYLYGDGKIVCPKNSLILVTDESEMFTLKKANGDVFLSARYDAVEGISSKADLEEWFITNAVSTGGGSVDPEQLAGLIADAEYISSATTIAFYNLDGDEVCSIDATDFIKDGMVDNVVISGSNLVITWNTSAGKQPISIPLSSIFDPSNYYDKSATDTLLSGKVAVSDYNTYTANTNTALSGKVDNATYTAYTAATDAELSDKVDSYDFGQLSSAFSAHKNNTTIHVTSDNKTLWDSVSGKADTSAVTAAIDAVNASLSGKASTDYVDSAVSGKQDTLVYYSEDEDNGIATIKCGGDDEPHADIQVALGDATITAMDMPEEGKYEYEQIVVYTNQIELNQGKLEYNEDLGEFEQVDYTHELTLNEDGIEINGDQIVTETALSDALSGKQDTLIAGSGITISGNVISADGGGSITIDPTLDSGSTNAVANSAITAAVDAVTPCVFDFGRASTLGITDADWNGVMDAYVNHKPIIAVLGIMRYVCESLVLNTDASDNQVFTFTVSDDTSRYILDVTNLGNSQYQITRYDTIALPTTNDITNWNGKQDTLIAGSGITISGNVISADGGGGGMSEDDELLLATALVDLNDRKMDTADAKAEFAKYQKKGDYVTSAVLDTRLADYETALDEQNVEEVTSYALNDLNERLTTVETALGGLSLSAITQSQWATISGSANPSTIYIITNNE